MTRLHRCLPFLRWPRPTAALLRGEAWAGLTVGLMVIPQGVAYAALAGMPLVTGIYASLLPALVAVLFGGSPRLSVGPTALSCLLVSASLTGLALPGSPDWVALAVWLALLSGGLQVALGLARFGWLLNLVNAPVLMAFTQAAALLIIGSQLPALLGLPGWDPTRLADAHLPSLAFGLGSLAVLLLARRWRPHWPVVLVLVLGTAGLSQALDFAAQGGAVVGALPQGLPSLYLPTWPGWQTLGQLAVPVLVITLVSFLETAASAQVDNARRGERWDQNQDLIGQGLAKVASGLSGAFPTSSSFSRSALNLYAGAQTGWATVFAVGLVVLALWLFLPVLHHVPQAVLAAIVWVAVVGLVQPRAFVRLWRISRVEAVTAGATVLITLLTAPRLYWGVLAGMLMALSHFLYQRLHPRIIEVGLHPDGRLRDRHLWQLPPLAPRTCALRMDADLDFGSASALEDAVAQHLALAPDTQHVLWLAAPVNRIDATGVDTFGRLRRQLAEQRRHLWLVGVKLPVETVLRQAGELPESPWLHLHATEAAALQALREQTGTAPQDPAAAVL
ncbi:SulP family inorganic anion transporter [Aquabacterium sp. A08]|uniref:SulP family inorganic anion transporter n=1 Tax=Aquabacterium sp. A08 TaxID=2718532 RepID=UPI0014225405|nr:SulP family inorganic anion transporter [Aquabacterium sp. A08]NIC43682.1 SulP family inorganic anion transporter [Aquabacterium sp. A08]